MLFKELQDGGRFAAGQNQAVERCKLIGLPDLDWVCADFCESAGVTGEVALYGQNADAG